MFIQEMTEAECLTTLARTRLGRLACAHENQPYVVPIYFVYEQLYLYGFTTPGQKVEWMRSNPQVCVELDEIVDDTQWMSIIIFGNYKELPDSQEGKEGGNWERQHAFELLQQYAEWWEPGIASSIHRHTVEPWVPIFYRIRIDRVSGRRVTPSPSGESRSRTPPWLVRVFHALFKPLFGWRK
jgi:nitroimidazol reductase NimA-like FMN-containing flavoprotein (pyridoxamine 5'-phosphate oxidase superfamily)